MVVIPQQGTEAGVGWHTYENDPNAKKEGLAFWVRGNRGTLSSSGFGSCVGLALYGNITGYGAIAHFWNPAGKDAASEITENYMRWLFTETGGYAGDDAQALIFGGSAVNDKIGKELTRPRMTAIRDYLESRWDMHVVVNEIGSSWVKLNLDGPMGPIEEKVTLEKGLASSKPQDNSVSALGKALHGGGSRESGIGGRKRTGSG